MAFGLPKFGPQKPPQQPGATPQPTMPNPTPPVPTPPVFQGVQNPNAGKMAPGLGSKPSLLSNLISANKGNVTQGVNTAGAMAAGPRAGIQAGATVGTNAGNSANVTPDPTDLTGQIKDFYGNLTKQQDADWQQQQGLLKGQMAGFQREADSLNARMGGSIAGGYAGLAGSGLNQGMNAFNKAALAYNQLRQQTGQQAFNAMLNEQQTQRGRAWALTDQANQQAYDEKQKAIDAAQSDPNYGDNLAYGDKYISGQWDAAAQKFSPDDKKQYDKLVQQFRLSGSKGDLDTLQNFMASKGVQTQTQQQQYDASHPHGDVAGWAYNASNLGVGQNANYNSLVNKPPKDGNSYTYNPITGQWTKKS